VVVVGASVVVVVVVAASVVVDVVVAGRVALRVADPSPPPPQAARATLVRNRKGNARHTMTSLSTVRRRTRDGHPPSRG
jgi:hypothetical protein